MAGIESLARRAPAPAATPQVAVGRDWLGALCENFGALIDFAVDHGYYDNQALPTGEGAARFARHETLEADLIRRAYPNPTPRPTRGRQERSTP